MARKIDVDAMIAADPLDLIVGGETHRIENLNVGSVLDLQEAAESGSGAQATKALLAILEPLGIPRDELLKWSYRRVLVAVKAIGEHFTTLTITPAADAWTVSPANPETPAVN